MFCKPVANDLNIKDRAFRRADGVLEGLKAGGAEVEREAFEGGTIGGFLRYIRSGARGVCVGGVPL